MQHNVFYRGLTSIEQVAAIYTEAIARGHVFNDGNKRTALIATITFLEWNGYEILASDDDLAKWVEDIAKKTKDCSQFAVWLKSKLRETETAPEVEPS
ncbi:type II toxin-antitoxin system death-on-curing family toxin [Microbulbifer thermotolerans]|uniref:type II toxin-antitoxin system death-on-curing family toxin n=1 Tax=Microbulbifer thermotolerans TaxID=252514 RepID=UPI00396A1DC5